MDAGRYNNTTPARGRGRSWERSWLRDLKSGTHTAGILRDQYPQKAQCPRPGVRSAEVAKAGFGRKDRAAVGQN